MIQIKFTQPPAFSIGGLDLEIVPKRRDTLAKIAIYGIIRNYSLDKIWADASPTKLGPFANFAHSLINHRFGASVAAECLVYLREHDPLTALLQPKDRPLASESDRFAIDRMVDLEFAEIDPKSIYAREFVASGHVIDLEAALAKTETSEKLHQDMLRDIAEYLISKGVTPYETRSVDLMTRSAGRMNIFEIKSTNIGNLFAQSSKGSFQLACYCEAMKDDYDHLRPILIIHKTNDNASEKMCINILERLGISCLIYDPSHDWPNRIPNLFCDLE
jgi:hypothetical protein